MIENRWRKESNWIQSNRRGEQGRKKDIIVGWMLSLVQKGWGNQLVVPKGYVSFIEKFESKWKYYWLCCHWNFWFFLSKMKAVTMFSEPSKALYESDYSFRKTHSPFSVGFVIYFNLQLTNISFALIEWQCHLRFTFNYLSAPEVGLFEYILWIYFIL